MNDRAGPSTAEQRIALEAAHWLVRCDAGLNPAERLELTRWLEKDSRHGEEFARHQSVWNEFDLLAAGNAATAPGPALPSRAKPPHRWIVPLAAAASIALGLFAWRPWTRDFLGRQPPPVESEAYLRRVLEDGSIAELNRGALIEVRFTPGERRVTLVRGEANFTVAKNPARPFIVQAGGVNVRAVGTAFDVRLGAAAVEVLVTEGRVRVNPTSSLAASEIPTLAAGQRAVVSLPLAGLPPRIVRLSADEISRMLAWRPRLLDFTSAPLSQVVTEFNRYNRVQLIIGDPGLASLPIVASLRSDNVEGFVRLLKLTAGVQAEPHGKDQIILRRKL